MVNVVEPMKAVKKQINDFKLVPKRFFFQFGS